MRHLCKQLFGCNKIATSFYFSFFSEKSFQYKFNKTNWKFVVVWFYKNTKTNFSWNIEWELNLNKTKKRFKNRKKKKFRLLYEENLQVFLLISFNSIWCYCFVFFRISFFLGSDDFSNGFVKNSGSFWSLCDFVYSVNW